jgi:hypothetical protein
MPAKRDTRVDPPPSGRQVQRHADARLCVRIVRDVSERLEPSRVAPRHGGLRGALTDEFWRQDLRNNSNAMVRSAPGGRASRQLAPLVGDTTRLTDRPAQSDTGQEHGIGQGRVGGAEPVDR